jgi:hypothetical protein
VPLAATPLTTATIAAAGTTMCYSVPTTGTYSRDLILTNGATGSGTAFTVFVATGSASVSTTSGFPIPPGQSLVLTGQVAAGAIGSSNNQIYATCVSAATLVVGLGSVVSNI